MQYIVSQFTESELVNIGRAMESLGYSSIEKFIADAAAEKAAAVTGRANP